MTGTPLGSEFSAGTSSAGRLKPDTLLTAFGTVNHRLHHQRRAAIGTFFSKRAMTDVEPLIHANVKTLCDTIRRQQERDGHVELRVNFLAMTTDTIANHSLNGSNPQNTISLLENEERAAEWKRTIAALAMLTPIVKQATWLIPVALKVPVAIWMMTIPSLGRIVRLNRVSGFSGTKPTLLSFRWKLTPAQRCRTCTAQLSPTLIKPFTIPKRLKARSSLLPNTTTSSAQYCKALCRRRRRPPSVLDKRALFPLPPAVRLAAGC